MTKYLALLSLSGCSLMFEPIPVNVAPDADPSSPDADPSAPDASPEVSLAPGALGTYSIAFEVTATCATSVYAADTLDVSSEGLIFRSEACAAHEDTSASYAEIDAESVLVDALVLWNCERTIRLDVKPFVLTLADGQGFADIQADQIIPPQTNVVCAGEYSLEALKEGA